MPLAARLARLPLVAQALTLSSFVPDDQDKKLALIADANGLLDSTLNPFDVKPPPSDARSMAELARPPPTSCAPRPATRSDKPPPDARRLADALEALAERHRRPIAPAPPKPSCPGLKTMLRQLSDSLTPQPGHAGHHAGRR